MNKKAYKRCYDICDDKTEYKVFPVNCPIKREYCFGGHVYIGDVKPEFTMEDICKYYEEDSFNDFENHIECKFSKMANVLYCPGKRWKCPVALNCDHNNSQKSNDNYITPKYVGDNGCIYFIKNYQDCELTYDFGGK